MIRIAICDDDRRFAESLAARVDAFLTQNQVEAAIRVFYDAESFLASEVGEYQVMLLDMDLGSRNGIEVARELRNAQIGALIVYISAYIEMAPRGYEVNAFRYLLKHDLEELLEDTLGDVLRELENRNQVYEVTAKGRSESVYLADIRYFESFKRYVVIHTETEEYKQYRKISDLEAELGERGFLRVHKSFLVNMEKITCFQNKEVRLDDGTHLPCSRTAYKQILSRYMLWKGRR